MRPVCDVPMYFALSGNTWEKVMRLLPARTCAPKPMRKAGLLDQASASRTSLIAPRTLLFSVSVTVSVVAPTVCSRCRLVSSDRSRKVEELRPSVHDWPSGSTPETRGNRAVIVFAFPDDVVTLRNSGEYWKNRADAPTPANAAGVTRLKASKSA